jgi:hypothetical protein
MPKKNKVPQMFSRRELWALINRAESIAAIPGLNHHWKSAYTALAEAADRVDAMMGRSSVDPEPGSIHMRICDAIDNMKRGTKKK